MTRAEFFAAVRRERINPESFTLLGGLPCEQYTLAEDGSHWHVYYGERGQRSGLRTFDSEADALDVLFADLHQDQTTRLK